MNFYSFALFLFLFVSLNNSSPVGHEDQQNEDVTTTRRPRISFEDDDDTTTTLPTFTGSIQRLDAPIERIEIRLIDDNVTYSVPEVTVSTVREEEEERLQAGEDHITTTELIPEDHVHGPDPSPAPTESSPSQDDMYRKVEYVVQPTSIEPTHLPSELESQSHPTEPIVIGEDPNYYSTVPSNKQTSAEIQAKAWISVSTSVPKFEGDIDEDDLPPPPVSEDSENEEPEEECLANKEKLTDEVIERLRSETSMYYRLVRQRNEQQKEYCGGGEATDTTSEMYRRCSNWRAEKLVYYYKLMRKTYCQVDNWPNSPKIKKTYGEYLNLFGTFYAFQK